MASKSLGTLFSDSIAVLKKNLTVVIIGAVVFGAVMQAVGWWTVGTAGVMGGGNFGAWQGQMQQNAQRLQQLEQQAATGVLDQASQQEMKNLSDQMMQGSAQGVGMMRGVFLAMLPAIGLSILFVIILGAIAKSYFLIIAVKGPKDIGATVKILMQYFFPLLGLWIWLALRSFIWIPFLGIILAIILGPRFVLSPLYLLEEKKGILDSARLSYRKTLGYWGKIFGNTFVVGLVTIICSAIIGKILTALLGLSIGGMLAAMIGQFAAAFIVIFAIQLARTVMSNPRAV